MIVWKSVLDGDYYNFVYNPVFEEQKCYISRLVEKGWEILTMVDSYLLERENLKQEIITSE